MFSSIKPLCRSIAVVALVLLSGCAGVNPPAASSDTAPIIRESTAPYAMAPLDEVHVVSATGPSETFQISPEGMIDLAGGSRRVKGMPVEQFRRLVAKSYPSAREISITEFRLNQVAVLGEVFHQIHTDLGDGPMRVMDAIAAANGFTPLANKRRVKLIRQNAGQVTVYELDLREMMQGGDIGQNMLLEPGDVITVPRNFL